MRFLRVFSGVFFLFLTTAVHAAVIKTFTVTGVGSINSAFGAPLSINGSTTYTPSLAYLDNNGILSFTITGLQTTDVLDPLIVTEAVIINGNYTDGLFAPTSNSRTVTTKCAVGLCEAQTSPPDSYSGIYILSPYAINAVTKSNFLVTNARTFTFSEECTAGNEVGCGGPIFAAPVPGSIWMFGSGILGLITASRRRL